MIQSAFPARINALTPDARRQWGSMSVGQMLTHCTDQLQIVLGEKPARSVGNSFSRWLTKWVVLGTVRDMPKNLRTVPELDPNKELMTQPGDFAKDRENLLAALARLYNLPDNQPISHPVFGTMSKSQAIKLSHIHLDHHMRQFGVE
jgi:hypothetical protein